MGLFDLLANTVEGVAQVAIGTTKLAVAPFDPEKDIDNITEGFKKIGNSDDLDKNKRR